MDKPDANPNEILDEYSQSECSCEDVASRALEETDRLMQTLAKLQQRRLQLAGGVGNGEYWDTLIKEADIELIANLNAFYVALLKTL